MRRTTKTLFCSVLLFTLLILSESSKVYASNDILSSNADMSVEWEK